MKPLHLAVLTLPLIAGGCHVAVPVVTAGLGFGAAALTFDTEALKVWDERHPPAPAPQKP